jgi:hypothetical protein
MLHSYTLISTVSSPSFSAADWTEDGGTTSVAYGNQPGDIAVINGISSGGLTVDENLQGASIEFQGSQAYSLIFPSAGASVAVSTITFQSTLTIDVTLGASATISSTISGSNNELVSAGAGTLTLTANVTVAGFTELLGSLVLNGSTTITNSDGLMSPTGLLVENDATITGTGPLVLQAQSPNAQPFFNYESSSVTSFYSGPISGQGGVTVDAPTSDSTCLLAVASAANSFSGGTYLVNGEMLLEMDPILNAPATLGTGGVTIASGGILNLNGCSLTLPTLNSTTTNGNIENIPTATGSGPTGVTVLTLDNQAACVFNANIGSGPAPTQPIRFVKTGTGALSILDLDVAAFELDQGTVTSLDSGGVPVLDMNGGVLDLNDFGLGVGQLEGTGGEITDSVLINLNDGHDGSQFAVSSDAPSVFGGSIVGLPGIYPSTTGLFVQGNSSLTVTGSIACNVEVHSPLQIGDGRGGQTNGSLSGTVYVHSANGLTFDVAAGTTAECNAIIDGPAQEDDEGEPEFGSVLKIGGGNLVLAPELPNSDTPAQDTYIGAMRVDGGTLTTGNPGALAAGTQLIVDDGAEVNLDGNSITGSSAALSTVTLNNGSIVSNSGGANPANLTATLSAADSFNVANGSIGADVTLDGTASLNKRTDGTVNIQGTVGSDVQTAGVYVDQGTLTGAPSTALTELYWDPPTSVTSPEWDTTDAYWSETGGANPTDLQAWPTTNDSTYVAVFEPALDPCTARTP